VVLARVAAADVVAADAGSALMASIATDAAMRESRRNM